jgi:hypothetical protein
VLAGGPAVPWNVVAWDLALSFTLFRKVLQRENAPTHFSLFGHDFRTGPASPQLLSPA